MNSTPRLPPSAWVSVVAAIVAATGVFGAVSGWASFGQIPDVVAGVTLVAAIIATAAGIRCFKLIRHNPAPFRDDLVGMAVGVPVVAAFFGVLFILPVCQMNGRGTAYQRFKTPLRRIAQAMQAYADDHHGELPPAALTAPDGRPLLSWRVVLLPYLGHADLFAQFHLDEPWDSPHNRALLDQMPDEYRWPQNPRGENQTYYQVFVGPGTAFERPGLSLHRDFPDGLDTILVIEARTPVPWSQPADLAYDPKGPLPALGPDLRSDRLRRNLNDVTAFATLASGYVQHLYKQWTEADLRAWITRNGADQLPPH
jgi:hypothetical protein